MNQNTSSYIYTFAQIIYIYFLISVKHRNCFQDKMSTEIEIKLLLSTLPYNNLFTASFEMKQYYLKFENVNDLLKRLSPHLMGVQLEELSKMESITECRIRSKKNLVDASTQYTITAKGKGSLVRPETEFLVPKRIFEDLYQSFNIVGSIHKFRHEAKTKTKEIKHLEFDEFVQTSEEKQSNQPPLVLCEIEFHSHPSDVLINSIIETLKRTVPKVENVTENVYYKNINIAKRNVQKTIDIKSVEEQGSVSWWNYIKSFVV